MEISNNIYFTKSELLESKEELNESFIENALLIAGFIPVIGEVADTVLIIKYLKEKRYIEAGLMMFALIPTVGDIAVKPFLAIGRRLKIFSSSSRFAGALAKNGKLRMMYEKIFPYMNSPQITKLINQTGKALPKAAKDMRIARDFHINYAGKLVIAPTKKGIGYGVKQMARGGALEKYLAKHNGVLPPNALSSWWNIVYKGRRNRKGLIRKVLIGSNLLGAFGVYNIEDLERKMSSPKEAQELANNPKFQEFSKYVTTDQDIQDMQQQPEPISDTKTSGMGNILGAGITIPLLKSIARFV